MGTVGVEGCGAAGSIVAVGFGAGVEIGDGVATLGCGVGVLIGSLTSASADFTSHVPL